MKKLLFLITAITMILVCVFSSSAESAEKFYWNDETYVESNSTKIVDNVVYKLYNIGESKWYEVYDWFDTKENAETAQEINIVSEIDGIKVTAIRFNDEPLRYIDNHNYSVKKVTIPDSIKSIGNRFFSVLDGLEELTIPASVKYLACDDPLPISNAFYEMESLKNITFLGDIESLGGFANCKKLETVVFNGSVEEIYMDAFKNCESLKEFTIPETVKLIMGGAFKNSGLTSVIIPGNVESFTYDGDYCGAFEDCKNLTEVAFSESNVKHLSISDDTFRNCTALKTVTLPEKSDSITIGYRAFRDCKNLTTVNNTENITKIYGGAFRDCTSLESFTISEKTTMIGKNAFYGCTNLKNVTVNSKTKAPKLYSGAFGKTNSALTFTAKNATSAKNWKTALTKSGLKNAKVGYMQYV